ncbi:uncharacterized protein MONBRDRAFT_33174 [Monosiga brevicollis MX1]|uniref:Uncharacterized protein n=1 Tax=Monosiga brevicollis TaxID=81824 RepID=A9V3H9_MONBE|nr:uncharacterized protein MONBRDRAFT_33174 [Monosiga brevicollis MX1]EDQ87816.1 predicted protein [Monosiga brevicollis MX1]|eukprot:XP_001747349.1 hypothetical protein [Monosiga brevicollis MX1]
MTLFQAREWWSTVVAEPESLSQACMVVDNLDNAADRADKIAVASYAGTLHVYAPSGQGADPEHDKRLERDLGIPILQLQVADVSGDNLNNLVVLHPREVVVYQVQSDSSGGLQLEQVYRHHLKRTAANMVIGHFGQSEIAMICIQSMDGALTFFKKNREMLVRYLPDFLLPGPLDYVAEDDLLVTANSSWHIKAYKFRSMAAVSEESSSQQQQASNQVSAEQSTKTGKKITEEFSFNLGEETMAISHVKVQDQSRLVVLGATSMYYLNMAGELLSCKRFEANCNCLATYRVVDQQINLLLGCDDGILRVLRDKTVIWAAGGVSQPLALSTFDSPSLPGLIAIVSAEGHLTLYYLGTDPSLPQLTQPSRPMNHEALDAEMTELQSVIRAAAAGALSKDTAQEHIHLSHGAFVHDEMVDPETGFTLSHGTTVSIATAADVTATQLSVRIVALTPIVCDHEEISLGDQEISTGTTVDVRLHFGLADSLPPSALEVKLVVDCIINDEPHVYDYTFSLPLDMALQPAAAEKQADYKLTILTNQPPVGMNTLFGDALEGLHGNETPAIGFRMQHSDSLVSVIAAKTSGRYRVQSNDFAALAIPLQALTAALHAHFKRQGQEVKVEFAEAMPLDPYFRILEQHFEMRNAIRALRVALDEAATQYRLLQKRLLARFKDPSPSNIDQFTALLEGSYQQACSRCTERCPCHELGPANCV